MIKKILLWSPLAVILIIAVLIINILNNSMAEGSLGAELDNGD